MDEYLCIYKKILKINVNFFYGKKVKFIGKKNLTINKIKELTYGREMKYQRKYLILCSGLIKKKFQKKKKNICMTIIKKDIFYNNWKNLA